MRKKISWRIVISITAIIMLGSNLRAPIVAVGPVIPEILQDLQLSPILISLITSIPLACFAFGSPFVPRLQNSFGLERTLLFAIVFLGLGIVIRSFGNSLYLFLGSTIIGIAITIANVLVPAYIKKAFPNRLGLITAFYLASMNLMAAIAVAFSVKIGEIGNIGWKGSIGIWILLVGITFLIWLSTLKEKSSIKKPSKSSNFKKVWTSPLAWNISLLMGTQSVVYYVFATWYPSILQTWGMDVVSAGKMLSYVHLSQVPGVLLGPLFADRLNKQTPLIWIAFLGLFSGLILLATLETELAVLASVLIGSSIGLAFSLATIFFILRTENVSDAAELSGMAQSVGYFIAAFFPPIFGGIFYFTQSWKIPIFILIGIAILLLITGLTSASDKKITDRKKILIP